MNAKLRLLVCLGMSFLLGLAGCAKKPSEVPSRNTDSKIHEIHWEGGVSTLTVIYQFDGVVIGRGKAAYDILLKKMAELPVGSHLKFVMPVDIFELLTSTTNVVAPLPFASDADGLHQFLSFCAQKEFQYEMSAYRQEEYLAKGGIK